MNLDVLKFDAQGLIPAVVQDVSSGQVLMLAYMNQASLEITLKTQEVTYFSRSRNALWKKGETSGHTQTLHAISYDCDADTLLLKVAQKGVACHTLEKSCFYRSFGEPVPASSSVLDEIAATIKDREVRPVEGSYTNYLLEKGIDKTLKKVGEESAEVIIAAKGDDEDAFINEVSDLFYHVSVLLHQKNVSYEKIYQCLKERQTPKEPHD